MKLEEIKLQESSVSVIFGKQDHDEEYCDYSNAKLTSLEGSPKHVSDDFTCFSNNLKSLKGGPEYVGGDFYCYHNGLTSLEGAPSWVDGIFNCRDNNLTSLHNIHKHIKHIGGMLYASRNPIKSHVLGVVLIDGIKNIWIDNKKVQDIINKHLDGDKDVFACQEELIENGYEDYAKL